MRRRLYCAGSRWAYSHFATINCPHSLPSCRCRLCKNTEASVAQFIKNTPRFDKTQVGEYLGEYGGFNQGVLRAFVESFDFGSLGFDDALRLYLSAFRLPGEAQKIDRFMDVFAREYCRCNPTIFAKTDTAYILAFSVIMLNTDHFNPNIREDRKMQVRATPCVNLRPPLYRHRGRCATTHLRGIISGYRSSYDRCSAYVCVRDVRPRPRPRVRACVCAQRGEFISINRGVDDSLTESFLGVVFDRITSNEIIMDVHDTHDTHSCMLYTNPSKHGYLEKQGPQVHSAQKPPIDAPRRLENLSGANLVLLPICCVVHCRLFSALHGNGGGLS